MTRHLPQITSIDNTLPTVLKALFGRREYYLTKGGLEAHSLSALKNIIL
jgi:hypothetical protein